MYHGDSAAKEDMDRTIFTVKIGVVWTKHRTLFSERNRPDAWGNLGEMVNFFKDSMSKWTMHLQ